MSPEATGTDITEAPSAVEIEPNPSSVAHEPMPTGRARRPRGLLALVAVLLVLAVVAGTLAAVFYGRWRSDRNTERQLRSAASGVVTALTTYDYTNLDDFHRRVLAGATGKFRNEFEDAFAPLKDSLTKTQVRSVGTVRKVYLSETSGSAAEAIVIADQVVTASGTQRPVQGQQLTVSLVRVGGQWRVDGLTYDVPSGGAGGTSTTPSTP